MNLARFKRLQQFFRKIQNSLSLFSPRCRIAQVTDQRGHGDDWVLKMQGPDVMLAEADEPCPTYWGSVLKKYQKGWSPEGFELGSAGVRKILRPLCYWIEFDLDRMPDFIS
jgi:hypothetical protein